MTGMVHVIGAGLAGLAAAERLSSRGQRVTLHEASPQAGGRCRSYYDPVLQRVVDNGNHLILSGNHAAMGYIHAICGTDAVTVMPEARFRFADLRSGERWTLAPNAGRFPFWIFDPRRHTPGTTAKDYLAPARLFFSGADTVIDDRMETRGPAWERVWHPLLLSGLNTEPAGASARLAATLFKESLGKGGTACRPVIATGGLGAALVDPAIAVLEARGVDIRLGASLKEIGFEGARAKSLRFASADIALDAHDRVVLATPPQVAAALVPGLVAPDRFSAIVNLHFLVETSKAEQSDSFLGVIGATTEWLFAFPDRLSVTISAADRLLQVPREELAQRIWSEVAALTGRSPDLPPWQVIREKRATFLGTPDQEARRPQARTRYDNLVVAGDWTQTGLPATIEGAIRSGHRAAAIAGQ